MTHNEHLLTILAEECVEVAQRATKALRFGLSEVQTGQALNNSERIARELEDLVALVELCQVHALLPFLDRERIEAKKQKVATYLAYSRDCGTLAGSDLALGPDRTARTNAVAHP